MRLRISKRHALGLAKLLVFIVVIATGTYKTLELDAKKYDDSVAGIQSVSTPAGSVLATLDIKGRAPKTGYERELFSNGWQPVGTCDMRNVILARDLVQTTFEAPTCKVASGTLNDPYTGKTILFVRGPDTSDDVQIDHVVALSDAWQKGAQQLSAEQRYAFANDPLELLAVEGNANQNKADGDAATWLPPNKTYRCAYVARQIAVKKKYSLWVTRSEYDAMAQVLATCPGQQIPQS